MPATSSLVGSLVSLSDRNRRALLRTIDEPTAAALLYDWPTWARPEQLTPTGRHWTKWLILAGRGWGKTRTGAEFIRANVEAGTMSRVALIGPTAADARDVMVEGESGLLAVCPPWNRPTYEPSKRRVTWPSGAIATLYSADEPDRLRGPQHDGAWGDEPAAWRYAEAYDQLMFGLRLGDRPRAIFTTTPRPIALVRDLIADPTCVVTRGSTFDNRANLAEAFFSQIVNKYEGTRLGRQELHAEVLDDVSGALWTRAMVSAAFAQQAPKFRRVVIAVDPAVTSGDSSDETGIVAAGLGVDGLAYIVRDASGRYSPNEWAKRAVDLYYALGADRLVAEVNNGGDLVQQTIRTVDRAVSFRAVHASRGKHVRAEPIAALYEQGKVKHVGGFSVMEDQMCAFTTEGYVGAGSPDRADAAVWALSDLMLARGLMTDLKRSDYRTAHHTA